jgi:FlaA1/EpsC-like NDP-sugar epimerase
MPQTTSTFSAPGLPRSLPTIAGRRLPTEWLPHLAAGSGALMTLFNLGAVAGAVVIAYLVRFDWSLSALERQNLDDCLLLLVSAQGLMLVVANLQRRSIRGLTRDDLWRIVAAASYGTLLALVAARVLGIAIPRSIWIAEWFFVISIVGGMRALACEFRERLGRWVATDTTRCLLVGTCPTSEAIVRTVNADPRAARRIVGLVAPAAAAHLVGRATLGVPVLGTIEQLEQLLVSRRIDEVVLVSGALLGRQVRDLEARCAGVGCCVRVIPEIESLVSGGLHVQPRPLEIADLLKREPVEIDLVGIGGWIGGATVLVTGAAGSIGSEICRQIARHAPGRLVLVDRSENGLFWLERELAQLAPQVEHVPCIADITDETRMDNVMTEHRPTIVFHAAAYKHVPLMEQHPGEAVKNIALASAGLARIAAAHDVETFVLISTDKAVNPTSVMGTCKRLAEQLVLTIGADTTTKFVAVRFGNVLDSAGSVVPLFREQILRGGPVTVTHSDIERFFMTIPEASRLVLQAGLMGAGGEVFVLDMGEPVRIADLARDMIRLSGLVEGRDIEIQYTGLRPGEKLYEELYDQQDETLLATRHPKVMAIRPEARDGFEPVQVLEMLRGISQDSADIVRRSLAALVSGYRPATETIIAGRLGPTKAGPDDESAVPAGPRRRIAA